ncbi:BRCA1 C terminus domain-containing protein [Poronia punctata]|nr:BRCA1 C terminus domain-containing protein [Poronia punctata]
MPSSSSSSIPKAAEPRYGQTFDAYNSSSTGHQRAENRLGGSTGWRDSRNKKLASQFAGGASGGPRVADSVGAGAEGYDERASGGGVIITSEARSRARCSVLDMLAKPGSMNPDPVPVPVPISKEGRSSSSGGGGGEEKKQQQQKTRGIFDGVVVYVNGSTHPLISDHRLKHVLAENGGYMSTHLGRRKVTHVVLGRPGSGGGLAGGKLQREISRLCGSGAAAVKYVSVEWVLESLRAGKRLSEARFVDHKIAAEKQRSVYGLLVKKEDEEKGKGKGAGGDDEGGLPPSGQRV